MKATLIRLAGLLVLLCSGLVYPESNISSKLWKITDNHQQIRGYLFGSAHLGVPEEKLFKSFPKLKEAIHSVSRVALENPFVFDIPEVNENAPEPARIDCTQGAGLYLSESEFTAFQARVAEIYGQDSEITQNAFCFNPGFFLNEGLQGQSELLFSGSAVDMVIANYSLDQGKSVTALEGYEALRYEETFSPGYQRLRLLNWIKARKPMLAQVDDEELKFIITGMAIRYFSSLDSSENFLFDNGIETNLILDWVERYQEQTEDKFSLKYRNLCWMSKVKELLNSRSSVLFVVGFYHLAGETGLVNLIRKQGFNVEPVTDD
ncbi:TraB/GumN family protein [Endozoicomonas gorgoniicola]|uniref:TraB/GumN family protein n=1 Tax=Endozoicomonas gorgoniicola TaxID=1234144 RepID=A0ABT3MQ83_9GAMM|nr:TraB/GumN family protein [Endozoicomonas gorgoniicola]MCW7551521.1 TraB/GumN family protein [Endozoicomonas gorgoniicola]